MRSDDLAQLVPPGQQLGYDLIVQVGLARYLDGKQRGEIQAALRQRGIELSTGSITNLCDRFLSHFESLHLLRTPHLRAAMCSGYPLHIDATCDGGKGGLFVCMDGLRGWVLLAERIDSESEEALRPVVERTVSLFGDPVSTMRDLGLGVAAAVKTLRERGIIDLVCHQHFLRAVGTRLLKTPYDQLRTLLKKSGVRAGIVALRRELRPALKGRDIVGGDGHVQVRQELLGLVHWLIDGDGKAEMKFPFGLHHLEFVVRCLGTTEVASQWVPRPWTVPERRLMGLLDGFRRKLNRDPEMTTTVMELRDCWRVFTELRTVLRLADCEKPSAENRARQLPIAPAELERLHAIKLAVRQYQQDLRDGAGTSADGNKRHPTPEAIVLGYLDKYEGHLFGHPAIYDADGRIVAVAERTNYPAEHSFGGSKQLLRRRLGRAKLASELQKQPAQAALVSNLRHADYVGLLCGSLEHLPHAFARLQRADVAAVRLVRDHRDSQMHQVVRRLLYRSPPPQTTRLPVPHASDGAHATKS